MSRGPNRRRALYDRRFVGRLVAGAVGHLRSLEKEVVQQGSLKYVLPI